MAETPYGERGTGFLPAPLNARALRYRLIQDPAAVTVDWNAAPSLREWLGEDIDDQLHEGSCVAQACTRCGEMLRRMRGLAAVHLCRNWNYFLGRVRAGLI